MPDILPRLEALHARMLANAGGDYEADCDDEFRLAMKEAWPDLLALARAVAVADLSCWSTACVKQCTCGRKAVRDVLARVRGGQDDG